MADTKAPGSASFDGTGAGPALCWHCESRPADPSHAGIVRLRRYDDDRSRETRVSVPTCRSCARARRRVKALWWGLLVAWSALLVVTIVQSQVVTGGVLAEVLLVSVFVAPFAVVLPIGAIGSARIIKRAGIVHADRGSWPEALQLKRSGWTTVRLPARVFRTAEAVVAGLDRLEQSAREGGTVQKTCSACHAIVPPESHGGQKCPHCGVYWNTEQWLGPPPRPY